MSLLEHCVVELIKIAAEDSANPSKKRSYFHAMVATAPIAAMQSAADVPEGWAEKGIETGLKRHWGVPLQHESSSLRRGLGRAAGRLSAATITTPLFLKGLRDVKEGKTHHDRRKGYGEVLGAGMGFAALKGGVEAGVEHAGTGKGTAEVLKKIRSLAGARTLIGAGSGLLTAATSAAMLKRQENNPNSLTERVGVPAATGAIFGAGKGVVEHAFEHGRNSLESPNRISELKAHVAGKAGSGLLAGLLFNEIFRHVLGKEKKSDAEIRVAPQPSEIYDQVRNWADGQPIEAVQDQLNKTENPETTPTRRAVYYAFHDSLAARGVTSLPPLLRREEVAPRIKAPTTVDTALVAAVISAPTIAWNLGFAKLPSSDQDRLLAGEIDRMMAARGIARLEAKKDFWGNPAAFFNPEKNTITVGKDALPEILAHELGHATAGGLRKKTVASLAAGAAYHASAPLTVLVPLFAIEGFNDRSFTTPEELESRARFLDRMGKVALVLQSPLLAEEAAATMKGMGYLTAAGGEKAALRGLRTLGPAFLTYAAPTAAPFIAAAYLRKKATKGRAKMATE